MNRPSSASPGPEARLPDALLSPQAWPEGTGPVELVETHISWVFLAGQLAYKVKKPVKLDFLDFSTRELRDHFCEEELRINRRFAPELYLGLSRVVRTEGGLAIDGPGEAVEHAVHRESGGSRGCAPPATAGCAPAAAGRPGARPDVDVLNVRLRQVAKGVHRFDIVIDKLVGQACDRRPEPLGTVGG